LATKSREDWVDNLWEALGVLALVVSLFLTIFGSWVWAQESMAVLDAKQNQDIAVLYSQVSGVQHDVKEIKDKLFSILLMVGGAVAASATSAVFSVRTHRRLKNGNQGDIRSVEGRR